MPQGGRRSRARIPGWPPSANFMRKPASRLGREARRRIADWLIYDIPRTIAGRAWKGRYRGQRQRKWYAISFHGQGQRRSMSPAPAAATRPSSSAGVGSRLKNLPDLIVPFQAPGLRARGQGVFPSLQIAKGDGSDVRQCNIRNDVIPGHAKHETRKSRDCGSAPSGASRK